MDAIMALPTPYTPDPEVEYAAGDFLAETRLPCSNYGANGGNTRPTGPSKPTLSGSVLH
jgi:hypothetical protein